MPNILSSATSKQMTKLIVYGVASLVLYVLLYLFEDEVLAFTEKGSWFFIIPVTAAFVFSFSHGNFTSHFWDVLGIKAKK
jgi:hypothetical protein